MKFVYFVGCLGLLLGAQAHAESVIVMPGGSPGSSVIVGRASPVFTGQTFTMHFQLSQTMQSTTTSADLAAFVASATQSLYDIANRECEVLGVSLKGTCRVTQVNVGSNLNSPANGRGLIATSTANAAYEIEPTPAAGTTGAAVPPAAAPSPAPAAPAR